MEFYIKKNSTLPVLKLEVIKDGRTDFNLNSFLSGDTTFLISLYDKSEDKFLFASKQCYVTSEFSPFEGKTLYYLNYQFSNKDTKKIGRYEVQISIPSPDGVIILPLEDKHYVNIIDSFAGEYLTYKNNTDTNIPCCYQNENLILNQLTLDTYYSPGSLNILYVLSSSSVFTSSITVNFTNTLEVLSGENFVITTGITINPGNITGQTLIHYGDFDFGNLNGTSIFSKVTILGSPTNVISNFYEDVTFDFPTPTPTPTVSSTPTITPTVTQTENIIPSQTPTITPTITKTPTTTPTPSSSPSEQNITDAILISPELGYINVGSSLYLKFIDPLVLEDPILTNNGDFILVGNSVYLKFIDPLVLEDPILTSDDDFILVGNDVYLKYIQPSPVPQNSPTPTPTVTPTQSITPSITSSPTPTQTPSNPAPPLISARYLRWTLLKKKSTQDNAIQLSDLNLVLNDNLVIWNPSATATSPDSTYAIQSESAQNIVDGNVNSKYCDISFGVGPTGTATIYIDNINNIGFDSYYYNTANDVPSRDPVSWTIEISDNNVDWTLIDTVTDASITNLRLTPTQRFYITPSPSPTTTPTSTPTLTPTITPTTTPTIYYYSVNGYGCGTPCYNVGQFVVKSPIPLTIGYFYNNPENRGYTFEILTLSPETPTNYDLTNEPGYSDCTVACYPPSPTPTQTQTQTPTVTPSTCIRNIVVPTLYNGATNINSNLLQLTETSETLQIQINDTITDFNGSTSFVGNLFSDGTYTYVYTGPGGGVAFDCQFPLTFTGPC